VFGRKYSGSTLVFDVVFSDFAGLTKETFFSAVAFGAPLLVTLCLLQPRRRMQ
jgi:hypothetical protein